MTLCCVFIDHLIPSGDLLELTYTSEDENGKDWCKKKASFYESCQMSHFKMYEMWEAHTCTIAILNSVTEAERLGVDYAAIIQ